VSPPTEKGIRETLRTGTDVVMLNHQDEKGRVIDGRTGKVRRTGSVPLDYDAWTVYEGLAVGLVGGGGGAVVDAYRLTDLKRAWQFKLPAGSSVDAVRPCGPKRVCVVADPPSGVDTYVHAVDMISGKEAWKMTAPSGMIDVGWYVVDGRLVFGEENWGSIGEASLIDTNGKVLRSGDGGATSVLCTDGGGRAAMQKIRPGGSGTWQVQVGHLGSGDITDAVDVGAEQPAAVALTGDSLVVLSAGADAHVRAYRVTLK